MKTALIISGILSVGGTISAFTWVPSAADSTRQWMNKPAIEAVRTLQTDNKQSMAGMKLYDIRTDELADDVRDLKTAIRELEKESQETPNISPAHRRSLERQIESYKKKLKKKGDMLDQATEADRRILSELTGITA